MGDPRPRFRFGKRLRLRRAQEFQAVRAARVRDKAGPLLLWAMPNALGHLRIGFALGRRVGNAVARNRIRRRVREAFRLMQHDDLGGYDLVISAERHDPLDTEAYGRLLAESIRRLDRKWARRAPPPGADA